MKKKIRKPMPKLQPNADASEAPLPGNAGSATAPVKNAQPKGGAVGFMKKKKLALRPAS
jgi:hypothetical protein